MKRLLIRGCVTHHGRNSLHANLKRHSYHHTVLNYKVRNEPCHWIDDVSNLNMRKMKSVHYPLNLDDLQEIIKNVKGTICVKGQAKTMGGHTLFENGNQVDMKFMNRIVDLDLTGETVTVEAGITWDQLMHFLDQYGYSPTILQSYVNFSVGGSISVDIHGITSHNSLSSSVVELELIDSSDNLIHCSDTLNKELFSLVLGGFGLFGIVYKVKLKITPNTKIDFRVSHFSKPESFHQYYMKGIYSKPNPNAIQLARINLLNGEIDYYEFPKIGDAYSAGLHGQPREMSTLSKIIYKWIGHTKHFRNLRFYLEKLLNHPLDWKKENDKNTLLYESANPMAALYSPYVEVNKTHILQEYFIPVDGFVEWYDFMMKQTHDLCQTENVNILNITIRFVMKNETKPLLTYARKDVYSFVFYYRANKNTTADRELEMIHHALSSKALELNGTFYLPYRHHYSVDQLLEAYPKFTDFVAFKKYLDPKGVFNNMWFNNYSKLVEDKVGSINAKPIRVSPFVDVFPSGATFGDQQNKNYHFMTSLSNQVNQSRVFDFLRYVFPVVDPNNLQRFLLVNKLLDDKKLYNLIQSTYFNSHLSKAKIFFNLIKYNMFTLSKEIENQISELLKNNILHNRKFDGQLTIGDCGRFMKLLKKKFKVSGPSYIVNDKERAKDTLERNSLTPVGLFVPYDKLQSIPSNSVDLVTCFIGMHHYTESELNLYMKELKRILRPNGLFILREHDVDNKHMESMVHVAHNIFNALTGLTFEDNEKEFRHFRSMNEWNRIFNSFGFHSLENYQVQHGDSTIDLMTAYINEKDIGDSINQSIEVSDNNIIGKLMNITDKDYNRVHAMTEYTIPEWFTVEIVQHMGRFLQHTPWYDFPYGHTILKFWQLFYHSTNRVIKRDGMKQAFSGYFWMNLSIGTISTILLSQMGILAILPRLGSKFSNNSTANLTTIQVIISSKEDIRATLEKCDIVIINQTLSERSEYLYHAKLSRFLPFTQSLKHLSKLAPFAQIEEIAGNETVNIKITTRNPDIIKFSSFVKCKEIENYKVVPNDEHHDETVILFTVNVKDVIQFLREATNLTGIEQVQIHDF